MENFRFLHVQHPAERKTVPVHLDFITIEPAHTADSTVILMHGLGADGHDFEALVPELDLPAAPSIRWVFPHAPVRPVTINGGLRMRAWYDIIAIDINAPEDEPGIRLSQEAVGRLIQNQRDLRIPSQRVVLAGFSQGGAIALFTALRWPEPLAGVIALSTYLPLPRTLATEAHPFNAGISIFMAHGTMDPVVPTVLGETSREVLLANGCSVEWHAYPMQHAVCAQEISDLRKWLLGILTAV